MLEIYREVAEDVCAVPVYKGEKSESERFAGATHTFSIEALMPDGRALQSATSHELGQNFARAYDITFAAEDQTLQHCWTTSWGMSWRMLGALIMTHGDDRGLRIPPRMAPTEVVIVPIPRGDTTRLDAAARELFAQCKAAGLRVKLDDKPGQSPGYKFNEWDMRGVPVRLELGNRDLDAGVVTLVRRDKAVKEEGQKQQVPLGEVVAFIPQMLEQIQHNLFAQAKTFLQDHTVATLDRDEFFRLVNERAGMIDVPWCGRHECEAAVKDATSASTRNLREPARAATCVPCGEPARYQAYFAQAY
ncbi:MAG TPA: His/Gly/Thr/Pro-type tRNA ligase C-terminal domain-containing protein, partial [Candidatus Elarobacter sp.]|nr:His/Gly/Thr/Pro-type tRNA ligase C-terminal domain-containing protein [Candidatus Elarobacter sp.]